MPAISPISLSMNPVTGFDNASSTHYPLEAVKISNSLTQFSRPERSATEIAQGHDLAYRAHKPAVGNEIKSELKKVDRQRLAECERLNRNMEVYMRLSIGTQFKNIKQYQNDKSEFKRRSCSEYLGFFSVIRPVDITLHPCDPRKKYDGNLAHFLGKIVQCNNLDFKKAFNAS